MDFDFQLFYRLQPIFVSLWSNVLDLVRFLNLEVEWGHLRIIWKMLGVHAALRRKNTLCQFLVKIELLSFLGHSGSTLSCGEIFWINYVVFREKIEVKHYLNLRKYQKAQKPRSKNTLSWLNVLVSVLPTKQFKPYLARTPYPVLRMFSLLCC